VRVFRARNHSSLYTRVKAARLFDTKAERGHGPILQRLELTHDSAGGNSSRRGIPTLDTPRLFVHEERHLGRARSVERPHDEKRVIFALDLTFPNHDRVLFERGSGVDQAL